MDYTHAQLCVGITYNRIYNAATEACVILGSFDPLCIHWVDLIALQGATGGECVTCCS